MKQRCGECGKNYEIPREQESMFGIWRNCPECQEKIGIWWASQKVYDTHICDISIKQLKEMHKNAIALIKKHGVFTIGTLLMGRYYLDGFSSRSCSGTMATLVADGDYTMFYCRSSDYLELCMEGRPLHPIDEELLADFNKACELDDEGMNMGEIR